MSPITRRTALQSALALAAGATLPAPAPAAATLVDDRRVVTVRGSMDLSRSDLISLGHALFAFTGLTYDASAPRTMSVRDGLAAGYFDRAAFAVAVRTATTHIADIGYENVGAFTIAFGD